MAKLMAKLMALSEYHPSSDFLRKVLNGIYFFLPVYLFSVNLFGCKWDPLPLTRFLLEPSGPSQSQWGFQNLVANALIGNLLAYDM